MRRILWFRRDLRTEDNRLLSLEGEVFPIFIFDPNILDKLPADDRRVSFIFTEVLKLRHALQELGLDLYLFYGNPEAVFLHLIETFHPDEVCASGDYDAYALERDRQISHMLPFNQLHDTYIFTPQELLKADGTPYLVFTPYYKQAQKIFSASHLKRAPRVEQRLIQADNDGITVCDDTHHARSLPATLESLGFEPVAHHVAPLASLLEALRDKLGSYPEARDMLDVDGTSHLSVHLRFGTLGIRSMLRHLVEQKKEGIDTEPFFRQLVFRDFYAYLLYHFPKLAWENHRYPFKGVHNPDYLSAFTTGTTGVPIVDAGIRELLQTGDMHNRVRMICASFFTKDLLLPWQEGERFFAAHLNDYDAASNILSWQWSAGTGIDPQPYFRIFNPYRQSERFDKQGNYIKQWVHELAELSAKQLHDENYLLQHAVTGYPSPIVVHHAAASKAKAYFKSQLGHT